MRTWPHDAPVRLCALLREGDVPAWVGEGLAMLEARGGIECSVRYSAAAPSGAPLSIASRWWRARLAALRPWGLGSAARARLASWAARDTAASPPDIILSFDDATAELPAGEGSHAQHWQLCDAAGRRLNHDFPLLVAITSGAGLALQLQRRTDSRASAGLAWQVVRSLHVRVQCDYARALTDLAVQACRLVEQAVTDWRRGVVPASPSGATRRPGAIAPARAAATSSANVIHGLRGAWRCWSARQRARWLADHWRVGVVDAPIHALLSQSSTPPVRWITPADGSEYWADPMGLPGAPPRVLAEHFDEQSGVGRLEQLDLDAADHVVKRTRLPVGGSAHASFPLVVELAGRRLGLAETCALRECVLHEVDDSGRWRPLVTMLSGVAAADPALFEWEGRFWLAYTDADLGEWDNLCLHHAERLEGPWLPHANNPVKVDVTSARMAGAFFQHDGALYRPAQDCLAAYGAAVMFLRIERCTPTEYTEVPVRHLTPDATSACPDGLHTVSAWGARTLVDGNRRAFSGPAFLRKLRRHRLTARAAPGAAVGGKVCVYLPHLRMGGGELSLLRLAGGFAKLGLKVDLVVHTLATAEVPVPAGVEIVDLQSDSTAGSLRRLARALRERKPSVLLSAFPHTNVAAVAAVAWAGVDCRCVISEHAPLSHQIERQGGWRYRLLPPLVRWAYRRADAVVAVSGGVRDDLAALIGAGLPLHVIANPVLNDADLAEPADAAGVHPWLRDDAVDVVLSVSRLSVEKDIPTLVHAFAALHAKRPNARLLLAGEGPDRARLEALIGELGLASVVALPGRVARPLTWMRRARVFALASQYEGFGNVLVEALASGVPVVSTDCPVGPREILEGGRYGELVPVGDWRAMASAMARALAHRAQPEGARAHALMFTEAGACAAYRRLFDSLRGGAAPC